nr:fimbrial protein [Providencia rettgeri]
MNRGMEMRGAYFLTICFKTLVLAGVCLFGALILLSFSHKAIAANLTTNIQIRVTVYGEPECTLGGATTTSVDFGDIHQARIDGTYGRSPINYNLVCNGLYKNALKMTLRWTDRQINGESSVTTNLTNLGIAIYRDGTRLSNGATLNFNYGNSPALYAVPVKPTGVNLTSGGDFTGNLTMVLDYQ